jgi:hypothetical protein
MVNLKKLSLAFGIKSRTTKKTPNENSNTVQNKGNENVKYVINEQQIFDWQKKFISHLEKNFLNKSFYFMICKYLDRHKEKFIQNLNVLKTSKMFQKKIKKISIENKSNETNVASLHEINLIQNFNLENEFFYKIHFDLFIKIILRKSVKKMVSFFDRPNLNLVDRMIYIVYTYYFFYVNFSYSFIFSKHKLLGTSSIS